MRQDEPFQPENAAPPPPRSPAAEGQPAGGVPYSDQAPDGVESNSDARLWGMLAHLSALAKYTGIPFGNIIGPLVCWLVKKDEHPFVDDQGKESLNFQISITIASLVIFAIGFVTMCIYIGVLILAVGIPAILIVDLVFVIIAAIKANAGEYYRYPVNIRIVR